MQWSFITSCSVRILEMKLFLRIRKWIKEKRLCRGRHSHESLTEVNTIFDAAFRGDFEECKKLLKENTSLNVNMRDTCRCTMLMTACQALCEEEEIYSFVTFLINNGAFIMEKDDFGKTAADYAHRNGLKDVVSLLCTTYEQIIQAALGL